MRTFARLRAPLAAAAAIATGLLLAPSALAAPNASCTGTLPPGTYGTVTVPAGASCTLNQGVTADNVVVNQAATLTDNAATVNNNLTANKPFGIGIGGVGPPPGGSGHVGGDLKIDGLTGTGPGAGGDNYLCNTYVGHDANVTNTAAGAGTWVIGDPPDCSYGNNITHDLNVVGNHNPVDVSNNTVGHDMNVKNNKPGPVVVSNNSSGHDANCDGNSGATFGGNTAAHNNNCAGTQQGFNYFQGCEQNTNDLFGVMREPSGFVPPGSNPYAPGVPSETGNFHCRAPLDTSSNCQPGDPTGGRTENCSGPFTDMGLNFSDYLFPPNGYTTSVGIYLDVAYAAAHPDYRFDFESAINNNNSFYNQGFDFNVASVPNSNNPPWSSAPPAGFVIQTSTNAGRMGANPNFPCPGPNTPPNDPCRPAVRIGTPGWYTFRQIFRNVGGQLQVEMQVVQDSTSAVVVDQFIWGTNSPPPNGDNISGYGGPGLLWFPNQEFDQLATDNWTLTSP